MELPQKVVLNHLFVDFGENIIRINWLKKEIILEDNENRQSINIKTLWILPLE